MAAPTLPLSLLIQIDYGSSLLAPKSLALNGGDTWRSQVNDIARQVGVDDLTKYTVRFATFGADVIEPGDDELRSIPLAALGISTGWTAHCAAPVELRPVRVKRSKADDKNGDSKQADADPFAGLTPSNIISKLKSAKGRSRRVALEYVDRYWREIIKTNQRDFAQLPSDVIVDIFKSDTLAAKEIEVFDVALTWARQRAENKDSAESMRSALSPLLPHIRFPLVAATDMALRISPSKVLLPEQELAIYSYIATQSEKSRSSGASGGGGGGSDMKTPEKVSGFLTKKRKPVGKSFTLDPNNKGASIALSNGNRTLTGGAVHTPGCVTGTETLSSGVHYWEVRVDRGRGSGHHFLGLVTPGVSMEGDLCRPGTLGWWYDGSSGIPGPCATAATGSFRFSVGQIVGLLLDFDRNILQMYINKRWTGEITLTSGLSF